MLIQLRRRTRFGLISIVRLCKLSTGRRSRLLGINSACPEYLLEKSVKKVMRILNIVGAATALFITSLSLPCPADVPRPEA